MSFVEAARFFAVAKSHDWIPLDLILEKWSFRKNDFWETIATKCTQLPISFQSWLLEKNIGAQELQILLSSEGLSLEPVYLAIIENRLSRQNGIQVLENAIELLLLGKSLREILPRESESFEFWLSRLKNLRFPKTSSSDEKSQGQLADLPWPGHSQARWVRQGDRSGIELKLFVANPAELKKSVLSLQKIQELLDQAPGTLWPEH